MKACHLISAAALCVVSQSAVLAWDATGHMLMADVAWDKLAADGATPIRDHINHLARLLRSKQAPYHFDSAAVWLDDIRSASSFSWHFVLVPWSPGGMTFAEPPGSDALRVINYRIALLRRGDLTETQEARNVAVVMHLVGDIHMPLHCITHDGDFLGTAVRVSGLRGIGTLHEFWDAAYRYDEVNGELRIYPIPGKDASPGEGPIAKWARWMAAEHPPSLGVNCLVPEHWARESFRIACTDGYTDLEDLPTRPHIKRLVRLLPGYVHRANVDACERLVLSGYRLANLLESIYGKDGVRTARSQPVLEADGQRRSPR